jgi:hypothetical protein
VIVTDDQRRWWFATHPEFRHKRTRSRRQGHEEDGTSDKVSPKAVDRYVNRALKYERDSGVVELLKLLKQICGTEGETSDTETGWGAEAGAGSRPPGRGTGATR